MPIRHVGRIISRVVLATIALPLVVGCDRTPELWHVASGRLARALGHDDEVMVVVCSPDGSLLVSGGCDSTVYLWGISH